MRRFTSIFQWPSKWSRVQRHIATNLLIGILIELLFVRFHHSRIVTNVQNAVLDAMMRVSAAWNNESTAAPPIVIVDIDEATHRAWGSPLILPRDTAGAVVARIVGAKPRALIVDLVLGRTIPPADSIHPFVLALRTAAPAPSSDARTPLFMVQPVDVAPGTGCLEVRPDRAAEQLRAEAQGLGLDLAMGTAVFVRDDDWTIRSWNTRESWCREAAPIPPIHVAVATAITNRPEAATHLQDHGVQRIVYSLGWAEGTASTRTSRLPNGDIVPALEVVSAQLLLGDQVSAEAFRDRVVILGGSFAEARDFYPTPLGPMPGSAVLANAIVSLADRGEFAPAPGWLRFGIVILVIVIASVVFAKVHHFWATLATSAIILAGCLPLSFLLLRQGRWLDFALPLIGIMLHNFAAQAEGALESRHAKHA